MKTTYEMESEFGPGGAPEFFAGCNDSRPWMFRIHTRSTVHGHGSEVVLRIEHCCHLRSGAELREQDWIKGRTVVDLSVNTHPAILATVRAAHDTFLQQVQSEMHIVWLNTAPSRC